MDDRTSRHRSAMTPRKTADGSRQRLQPRATAMITGRVERVSHAANRLADAIISATRAPADPRTLSAWGQQVGASRGTLRVWCRAAHTPARACLDFLRLLRAVQLSQNQVWDLFSLLDVIDERSVSRLLDRGAVRHFLAHTSAPSIDEFLAMQRFIERTDVLDAVAKRLAADGTRVSRNE
jgi:hypothetical protein